MILSGHSDQLVPVIFGAPPPASPAGWYNYLISMALSSNAKVFTVASAGQSNLAWLSIMAIHSYTKISMVPCERVKRERRASRLGLWSGGKSAAAPATVSGEPLAYPPFRRWATEPEMVWEGGPEALTREPGDLPPSNQPPPGGMSREHGDARADATTESF